MKDIYRVTIHGRILESRDLRQLLARAVNEKRVMDQRRRIQPRLQPPTLSSIGMAALAGPGRKAAYQAIQADSPM